MTNPTRMSCVTSCPAGSFGSTSVLHACIYCPIGKYQDQSAKADCKTPNGCFVAQSMGETSCSPCAKGKYYNADDFSCFNCVSTSSRRRLLRGSWSIMDNYLHDNIIFAQCECGVRCKDCMSGTYADQTSASSCKECPAGMYSRKDSSGPTECTSCPAGYYEDSIGTANCRVCANGKFGGIGRSTTCTSPCVPGKYLLQPSPTCSTCPTGKYQETASKEGCGVCPSGKFALQGASGASSCTACPTGYFSGSFEASSCIRCPVGYARNVDGSAYCFECSPGTFSAALGSEDCKSCPTGYVRFGNELGGVTKCYSCASGMYQPSTGMKACTQCAAGQYQDQVGETQCKVCHDGNWQDGVGAKSCKSW
jgi:hypothetical protein